MTYEKPVLISLDDISGPDIGPGGCGMGNVDQGCFGSALGLTLAIVVAVLVIVYAT